MKFLVLVAARATFALLLPFSTMAQVRCQSVFQSTSVELGGKAAMFTQFKIQETFPGRKISPLRVLSKSKNLVGNDVFHLAVDIFDLRTNSGVAKTETFDLEVEPTGLPKIPVRTSSVNSTPAHVSVKAVDDARNSGSLSLRDRYSHLEFSPDALEPLRGRWNPIGFRYGLPFGSEGARAPATKSDLYLMRSSFRNITNRPGSYQPTESGLIEVLNEQREVIWTSDIIRGEFGGIDLAPRFSDLMTEIDADPIQRGQARTVRLRHTHPGYFGNDYVGQSYIFSKNDIVATKQFRAYMDENNFGDLGLESYIVFMHPEIKSAQTPEYLRRSNAILYLERIGYLLDGNRPAVKKSR